MPTELMTQDASDGFDEEIDRAADEFEAAWRQGARPAIAVHLAKVPPSARRALLLELVEVDWEYRRKAGEQRGPDQYPGDLPDLLGKDGAYAAEWPGLRDRLLARAGGPPVADARAADPNGSTSSGAGLLDGPPDMTLASPVTPGRDGATVFPQIDGYRVIGFLGAGGMGDVFKAVQLGTRREVALKLMRGSFASDRARARFDREVELTARLDHPNIARVFDSGLHQNLYYYALELIDGLPLDRYIEKRQPTRREVLELFREICQTVAHAHQRAVIHRDLKPSNVLVSPDGRPHLLDFGLAKALADSRPGPLTAAAVKSHVSIEGELSGTPAYMSPEQAAGNSDSLDTRTDVYSLGVILYRLLCGRLPHETTGGLIETITRIREQDPLRPSHCKSDIDGELESLMLKALAKDPEERYASAGEMARDIDNYLQGEPLTARPHSTIYFLRKRLWKHRLRVSLAAAVLLALVSTAISAYVNVARAKNAAVRAGNEAVTARNAALADKAEALRQTAIAEGRRHEKALEEADKTVSLADFQGLSGNWAEAKTLYEAATRAYAAEGAETTRARVGTWNADRASPPPLNVYSGSNASSGAASVATSVALSADGRVAVTGSRDGHVRVWGPATGRLVRTLPAREGAVWSVALSGDGLRAVSGGADGNMVVWDLAAGSVVRAHPAPGGWVTRVALSPDGRTALSASGETPASITAHDDTLCLWDAGGPASSEASTPLHQFDAAGRVTGAVFSPDGTKLLTCGQELALWDVASGRKLRVFADSDRVICAAFSADGQSIVSGGAVGISDGIVQEWGTDLDKAELTLPVPGGPVVAVGFAPGNKNIFFSAAEDRTLRAWTSNGEKARTYSVPDRSPSEPGAQPPVAAFSGDGRTALYCGGDGTTTLWGLGEPVEAQTFSARDRAAGSGAAEGGAVADGPVRDGPLGDIAPFPGGTLALVRDRKGAAIWDLVMRKKLHPAHWGLRPADNDAVSPNGSYVATAQGGALTLFDARTLALLRSVPVARRANQPLAFSPDGRVLYVALDKDVAAIDTAAGREIGRLQGHEETVTSLAASSDGRLALTGSRDKTARLWDVSNPKAPRELCVLRGHADAVNAVCFSPDGKTAVSGGGNSNIEPGRSDFAVRLWDIAGRLGSPLPARTLIGHGERVRAVAFSPDGLLVASAGDDMKIRLWDPKTGDELRTLVGPTAPVLSIAFVPGSGALLSSGSDQVMRRWDLDAPLRRAELGAAFDAAAHALQTNTDDALPTSDPRLAACGRWYAWHGLDDWAADFLARAGAAATPADQLTLARCYWSLGRLDDADAAFRRSADARSRLGPMPNGYLDWCLESIAAEKAGKAAKGSAFDEQRH